MRKRGNRLPWVVLMWAASAAVLAAQERAGDWRLKIVGTRSATLGARELESTLGRHREEMTLTAKGTEHRYSGYPLSWIAALVDDPADETGSFFDQKHWEQGYAVVITATDGYSATLETREVRPGDVLLADRDGSVPIPPSIVGNVDRSLWVKDVALIEVGLEGVAGGRAGASRSGSAPQAEPVAPGFTFVLDLDGVEHPFTIEELRASPFYVEAAGSYTTSVGTTYTGVYGGVRLAPLIGLYVTLAPTDTVEFVAMDGYRMSYAAKDILDASDGEWILAFRMDGEYLPRDPGYIRTMKVGEGTPNIDGHLSVKMVQRVVVRQVGYQGFNLRIDGLAQAVLDRQTLESCLNCHGVDVHHVWRGHAANYRGISLWRLLAYGDDPVNAPHRVASSIATYDAEAAHRGYPVDVVAADGYANHLNARDLDRNDAILYGLRKDGSELPAEEWPAALVWESTAQVPEAIRPVRQVAKLVLSPPSR